MREVYYPVGVGTDSLGNLYIGDHGNGRIRKISQSGMMTTVQILVVQTFWNLAVDNKGQLVLFPSQVLTASPGSPQRAW